MKNKFKNIILFIALILSVSNAFAQTTEFTYQGSLKNGANPANGNYDIEFDVYDALTGGNYLNTVTNFNLPVVNGVFSLKIDLGVNMFTGGSRFLQFRVKQNGTATWTNLNPRQAVTSSPYSIKSLNADQLGGIAANQYVQTNAAVINAGTQFNIGGNRVLGIGGSSIFAGINAGLSNSSGISNSFFGASAGQQNTTGNFNSFFGESAGFSNTTGGNNTLIGNSANVGSNNLFNATAIGAGSLVSNSNSLILGNNVNVGIGISAPTFKLQIVDSLNTGLRVQTDTSGGTVASFGGNGAFQIDSPGIGGGRFTVTENGNVGIGTNNPNTKLQVQGGSVYIANPNSLIITSPNGACWFITVNNAGALSTISVTCP